VNTRKPAPEFDYLKTFGEFLAWSAKVGSLRGKRLQALREHAYINPRLASSTLSTVIDLRENAYQLFSAIAAGKAPPLTVANAFNKKLALAFQNVAMKFGIGNAEIYFIHDQISLDQSLNAIIKSAFDVLTQEDFQRIKECPRCGWLFLDTSKNGKRRWCDMNVCGSRDKALEYYYRRTKVSDSK
jgi:predicted RNA-binding Zn ribbon-like protein